MKENWRDKIKDWHIRIFCMISFSLMFCSIPQVIMKDWWITLHLAPIMIITGCIFGYGIIYSEEINKK